MRVLKLNPCPPACRYNSKTQASLPARSPERRGCAVLARRRVKNPSRRIQQPQTSAQAPSTAATPRGAAESAGGAAAKAARRVGAAGGRGERPTRTRGAAGTAAHNRDSPRAHRPSERERPSSERAPTAPPPEATRVAKPDERRPSPRGSQKMQKPSRIMTAHNALPPARSQEDAEAHPRPRAPRRGRVRARLDAREPRPRRARGEEVGRRAHGRGAQGRGAGRDVSSFVVPSRRAGVGGRGRATRIFRGGGSRPRRGAPRGYSEGVAALPRAATRIFRGRAARRHADIPRRRVAAPGRQADIPRRRVAAPGRHADSPRRRGATRIVRGGGAPRG